MVVASSKTIQEQVGFRFPRSKLKENHIFIEMEKERTLRSMLERAKRKGLNSGSFWMFFHLPVPCLATPAFSASSSSEVHFCFGFPIPLPNLNLQSFRPISKLRSWQLSSCSVSQLPRNGNRFYLCVSPSFCNLKKRCRFLSLNPSSTTPFPLSETPRSS